MQVLALDSSGLVASVAIVDEEQTLAEYTMNYKMTHSQTLLPMLDAVVKLMGFDLDTIDAIAVAGGPGSFTGLRIGSATAKGLGMALHKPLIHIPTAEGMAFNLFGSSGLICPIMDARRNQVYTGLYRYQEQFKVVEEQMALATTALIEKLNKYGEKVTFLGDGVPVYRDQIEAGIQVPYTFAPANMNRQRAASVGVLGLMRLKAGEIETAAGFRPDYLRASQAERERAEQENRNDCETDERSGDCCDCGH